MTLEEVSNLMPGDKIFAYGTPQNDILNLEIVSIHNKNITCKSDTQYYIYQYFVYDSIGRTFEECLYNIIKNYKFLIKDKLVNLEQKYAKKYPEYFI